MRRSGQPRRSSGRPSSTATAAAIATELRDRPATAPARRRRDAPGDRRRSRDSRRRSGLPVAHTLMGTGVLPPDHPQLLGMVGFWGSPAANRLAAEADVILAVGTRFPETDSSSWEPGVTFAIPPTRLIHVDIDPHEPGRNYPTTIAATADAGLALEAIVEAYGAADAGPRLRLGGAARASARRSWRRAGPTRRRPTSSRSCPSGSWPTSGRAMPGRHPGHRRRLEQERRRAAVPGRHARLVPDAGRLLDDGLRPVRRPRRGRVGRRPAGRRAGRRRRLRLEPERRGDRGRDGHRPDLGGHEQRAPSAPSPASSASTTARGFGCEFLADGAPYSPDFAAIARACGADGVRIGGRGRAPARAPGARVPRAARPSSTCRCATRRS